MRMDAFDSSSIFDMDEVSFLETQDFDLFPHDYVPWLISELDECSPSFPEFTDIG